MVIYMPMYSLVMSMLSTARSFDLFGMNSNEGKRGKREENADMPIKKHLLGQASNPRNMLSNMYRQMVVPRA